jgi:hypothetical protein
VTNEETRRSYLRSEELRRQLQAIAREMFEHLQLVGAPPSLVILTSDGRDTIHSLAQAREQAAREVAKLTNDLDDIRTEIRVRERQLVHLKEQQEKLNLGGL